MIEQESIHVDSKFQVMYIFKKKIGLRKQFIPNIHLFSIEQRSVVIYDYRGVGHHMNTE